MLVHLVGGRDDGTTIDLADPGRWDSPELLTRPLPDTIEVHTARPNRAVYRMVRATPDEVTYQLDPLLTQAYRVRPR